MGFALNYLLWHNFGCVYVNQPGLVNIPKPIYESGWLAQDGNVVDFWIPRRSIKSAVKARKWSGGLEVVQEHWRLAADVKSITLK